MTKEERRQYDKEYNEMGFKRLSNQRYYAKHREQVLARVLRNKKNRG